MQQVWISILVSAYLLYEGVQDLITKRISVFLGIPIFVIGMVYNFFQKTDLKFWLCGLLFSVFVCLFSYFCQGQIGFGDGAILLALSPILGKRVISMFFYGLFLCAVVGIVILVSKKATRKARLPLVPFMVIAYFLENVW